MPVMKAIAILGSTGSIGRQTLEIVESHPEDLKITALAAGAGNLPLLAQQIKNFAPALVAVPNQQAATDLKALLAGFAKFPEIVCGAEGLEAVAVDAQSDTLVTAVVGFLGLLPTAAAIARGKTIALANKETLVAAGNVIMPLARKHNVSIVPVDSEHSAIFQSLGQHTKSDVQKLLLTGSGGPFRTWDEAALSRATIADALRHPNWAMGRKITIDSATLMNKGLEIIEARWLFDIPPQNIEVVIHPQSILHSAVEFVDGSIVGQFGLPDMRLPIHYALFYPQRMPSPLVPRLDLITLGQLTFESPDVKRFPCLALARQAADSDSTMPCVLNAANEIAVAAFLQEKISFTDIPRLIEKVLHKHQPISQPGLDDILQADSWSRQISEELTAQAVR
jgi:1-deoxy-D-xylulose-5-phosphate reductoisomerase